MAGSRNVLGGVLIASGALLAVGSMLPWATISFGPISASVNGTSGDGRFTLFLAVPVLITGILLLQRELEKAWTIVSGIALVAAFGLTAYDLSSLPSPSHSSSGAIQFNIKVQLGTGLWLCLVASIVGLVVNGILLFGKVESASPRTAALEAIED